MSQISLAQGNNQGFDGMPSSTTSGVALGGSVSYRLQASRNIDGNEDPGVGFGTNPNPTIPISGRWSFSTRNRTVSAYDDVFYVYVDIENHSPNYYANVQIEVSGHVTGPPTLVAAGGGGVDTAAPTDDQALIFGAYASPAEAKTMRLAGYTYTGIDGSSKAYSYPASLNDSNHFNPRS